MKTILYADDNPNILTTAVEILKSWGYKVLQANDGRAVVDIVKNNEIDLIVMDVVMPMIDGFVLCNIFKNDPETKNIPIILLTGLNKQAFVDKGVQEGADYYMTKPIDWNELKTLLEQYLI